MSLSKINTTLIVGKLEKFLIYFKNFKMKNLWASLTNIKTIICAAHENYHTIKGPQKQENFETNFDLLYNVFSW